MSCLVRTTLGGGKDIIPERKTCKDRKDNSTKYVFLQGDVENGGTTKSPFPDRTDRYGTDAQAWRSVRKNRGAAGLDKVSIQMYEQNLHQNLASLMHDLKHRGEYKAHDLLRVYIPKGKRKRRPLGIPIVRDRVAQEVMRSLIEPIFDLYFSEYSFGFRKGYNAHMAVESILDATEQGLTCVVDADALYEV